MTPTSRMAITVRRTGKVLPLDSNGGRVPWFATVQPLRASPLPGCCSTQSVPSWSKVAMRCSGGTYLGLALSVVIRAMHTRNAVTATARVSILRVGRRTVVIPFSIAFPWSRMRNEKIAEAYQRELHAHGDNDQSHESRRRVAQKAASCASSPAGHEHHHDPHYDRGHRDRDEC